MKKYAQILNDNVHWIFEAEEKPNFAPNIILIDITAQPEVQEGWEYHAETGVFSEPTETEPQPTPEPEPTTEELIMAELQWQTQLLEMKGGASE